MKTRIITGACLCAAMAVLVLLAPISCVFCIGMAVLSAIAAFELLRVFGVEKEWQISIPTYVLSASFPFAAYYFKNETLVPFILVFMSVLFAFLVYLLGVAVFSHKKIKYSKVAEVFMSIAYVAISFTALSALMYVNNGILYFGIIVISSWGCDAGAYFIGSKFGKHKLIPDVSPNKSVEGAIGGLVSSVVLNLLYGFIISLCMPEVTVNYLAIALFAPILSVVAMVGDLIASLIKREYGIKDYSNIFPGHGGVVDRFDSVFPIATFLLMVSSVFAPFS